MKLSQPKIALYVGLVFASGALLGAFGHRLYSVASANVRPATSPEPGSWRARYIAETQRRCNLTDEQLTKLIQILDETRSRMDAVNARIEPEIRAIRKRTEPEQRNIVNEQIDKIRAMLTPEQRIEYEKFRQEREDLARSTSATKKSGASK
jgi:Spy/CpxP family protein refolding chaperone